MQIQLSDGVTVREVDLAVDDPEACVGDLVRTAAPAAPPGTGLSIDGRFAAPDLGLDEVGLYEGARAVLSSGPTPPPALPAGPALVVVAGPDAGRTLPLPPGESVLGRDAGCELVLDDPSLSGRHAALHLGTDGLVVRDLGSRNGTWVEGAAVTGATVLQPGATLRLGATLLRAVAVLPDDRTPGADWLHAGASGLVPFNRPPRAALPPAPAAVEVPEPPATSERSVTFSIISVIAPLIMGGALVYFTGRWYFAIFMLLSPIMAIGNYVTGRRRQTKERRAGGKAHAEALARFGEDLVTAAATERDRLEAVLPDLPEVVRRAHRRSTQLWQRRPDHEDWLHLRAGTADAPWEPPLEHAGAQQKVDESARAVLDAHARIPRSPVGVDLSAGGVVGIVGDRTAALALARSLVAQAAVHHGPADLGMVVAVGADRAGDWDWVKWLPHVRDDDGATRLLAAGREEADALLGALLEAAAEEEAKPGRWRAAGDAPTGRTRLVVLDDPGLTEGRRAPARLLLAGRGGPVAGIVLAETAEQLPAVVRTVVVVASDLGDAEVRRPQEGDAVPEVLTAGLREPHARELARVLARWEDPEFELVGAGLPGMVRLLPLLGLDEVDGPTLLQRWAQGDDGLRVPVGVSEDGVLWLDLVRDGPHGLVGGTTGSGKSELLRSVVAGLAANADPDHLVFVLVDYKGGSAFAECAGLPHTVGMVTDLDGTSGAGAGLPRGGAAPPRAGAARRGRRDLPEYLRRGAAGTAAPPRRRHRRVRHHGRRAARLHRRARRDRAAGSQPRAST
jgi:DNA segregation ATPase FtsK/SpoIIIE, S-DNA-T family